MLNLVLSLAVFATYSILPAVALDVKAIDAQIVPPKLTFKEKHPKVYRGFKKVRTVSRFMLPIIQCGGSAAQMILLFL